MTPDESIWAELIEQAWQARERAYAPYSNFKVGACLLTAEGERFSGCNVENLSFGLTMCAERVAVGSMIAAVGRRDVVAVAVVADTEPPLSPCGACRQVLAEFGDPVIRLVGRDEVWEQFTLQQLLPRARTGILER